MEKCVGKKQEVLDSKPDFVTVCLFDSYSFNFLISKVEIISLLTVVERIKCNRISESSF